MELNNIVTWLRENDATRLTELWREADAARGRFVGDAVHLRGLVEFSNHCVRRCGYCGLRAPNQKISRYRLSAEDILSCARHAASVGYGTVVLQSGEDPGIGKDWLSGVIRAIKGETPLAVTLSVGERSREELAAWRDAGADRYLLRFESSNRSLYDHIHPPRPNQDHSDRLEILGILRELDYEVGSGVMIGIPGQTYEDLARDVKLFAELNLDMIGSGPYVSHPDTPLGGAGQDAADGGREQVPASELMTYKVFALARLACPRANIPSTTALATLNPRNGHELALMRGANVVMPNLTPERHRTSYEIYPDKAAIYEQVARSDSPLRQRIAALGRHVGTGRGDSPRYIGHG
ncbi:MAG: [FeFe] hydrogenase H-cluster radical SAM maturase HydE [Pirellulaceae bacterium]